MVLDFSKERRCLLDHPLKSGGIVDECGGSRDFHAGHVNQDLDQQRNDVLFTLLRRTAIRGSKEIKERLVFLMKSYHALLTEFLVQLGEDIDEVEAHRRLLLLGFQGDGTTLRSGQTRTILLANDVVFFMEPFGPEQCIFGPAFDNREYHFIRSVKHGLHVGGALVHLSHRGLIRRSEDGAKPVFVVVGLGGDRWILGFRLLWATLEDQGDLGTNAVDVRKRTEDAEFVLCGEITERFELGGEIEEDAGGCYADMVKGVVVGETLKKKETAR